MDEVNELAQEVIIMRKGEGNGHFRSEVLKMVQKGKNVQKVKRYKRKKVPKTDFFSSEVFYNQHRGANAYSQAANPKKNFFLTVISPSVNLYLLYLFTFLYHFQYLPYFRQY
jgi:predicted ATPase